MNLYGFGYDVIFNLVAKKCAVPNGDTTYNTPYAYNPNNSTYGAPLAQNCSTQLFQTGFPNWLSDVNSAIDLRGLYVKCTSIGSTQYTTLLPSSFYSANTLKDISPITGQPIAFTTESIFYAQSGYFVTVVMIQWSNVFACKSRKVN